VPAPPPTDLVVDCGSPVILTASADAWIGEKNGSDNFGTDAILKVRSQGSADNFRALVRFALPALPSGCAVDSATLRLFAASATDGRTIQVIRAAGTWTESSVTWGTQPAAAGTPISMPSGSGTREWNVRDLVRDMYDADRAGGFLIRDAAEGGSGAEQSFHAKEKEDQPPTLVITFAPRP
jgi:hypothetical protein